MPTPTDAARAESVTAGSAAIAALYQERILDHYRHPRHKGALERATGVHTVKNPLCGDAITVGIFVQHGLVTDARFTGTGCSIMQASASMLMELVRERRVDEIAALEKQFEAMLAGGAADAALGELGALAGVAGFPARHKCARMPWTALRGALEQSADA